MGEQELPPQAILMQLVTGKFVTESIGALTRLKIPDLIGDNSVPVSELAAKSGANADALHRTLRFLAMVGVFSETSPKSYSLTPIGQILRTGVPGSMRDMAVWLTSPEHYKAWGALEYSVKTGLPGSDHVFGMPVFEYFHKENVALGSIFNDAMTAFATNTHATAVQAYDFSKFKKIVDVGGGHGALISSILQANPSATGIVYDLPEVVAGAPKLLSERGVADRCEAVGGDFFESVPAGGDAYIESVVVHDWSDEKAIKILSNCRKGMNPGAKMLLVEMVIAPGDAPHPGKALDMEMLVMTDGGRERSADEFASLLEKAGFKLVQIIPTQAPTCVIEGEAV